MSKQLIYISAVWGVTENPQVFSLVYCIMYTIFIYLVPFTVEWNSHPRSVHIPMEVYPYLQICPLFCGPNIPTQTYGLELWRYVYHLYPTAKLWRSIKSRSPYILFDTKEHDIHKDKGHPTYSSVHKKIRGKLKYQAFYHAYYDWRTFHMYAYLHTQLNKRTLIQSTLEK